MEAEDEVGRGWGGQRLR